MEQRLIMFKNKILRKIRGPTFDPERDQWIIWFNRELREKTRVPWIMTYIKGQRIKWYGHSMRNITQKE